MSAHEYGKDYRIKISDGGSTPAFLFIGGEGSFSIKRNSDSIDFSSKDDGAIKAMGWGQQTITISVSGKLKLPDAGIQQVDVVSKASPPEIEIEIVKNGVVKFRCLMGIANFSTDYANNANVPVTFDATAVQAPTVDALIAA